MAMILVEISDEYYKTYKDIDDMELSTGEVAIKNGIALPDNATKGDIMRALFPNEEQDISNRVIIPEKISWWEAPYNENKNNITK